MVEDFVRDVSTASCRLSMHRKSTTVQVKDAVVSVERGYGIKLCGYGETASSQYIKRPGRQYKQLVTQIDATKKQVETKKRKK
jgi:transcription initiation factor TFIID subunit TAF12